MPIGVPGGMMYDLVPALVSSSLVTGQSEEEEEVYNGEVW